MTTTIECEQDIIDKNISRLNWQCRRGMLELDLLLQGFLDKSYQSLNAVQKHAFEVLLQSPDQLLHDYLLGGTVPFDKDVADVIKQILHAAHS